MALLVWYFCGLYIHIYRYIHIYQQQQQYFQPLLFWHFKQMNAFIDMHVFIMPFVMGDEIKIEKGFLIKTQVFNNLAPGAFETGLCYLSLMGTAPLLQQSRSFNNPAELLKFYFGRWGGTYQLSFSKFEFLVSIQHIHTQLLWVTSSIMLFLNFFSANILFAQINCDDLVSEG